jgi:hypothetical protein
MEAHRISSEKRQARRDNSSELQKKTRRKKRERNFLAKERGFLIHITAELVISLLGMLPNM